MAGLKVAVRIRPRGTQSNLSIKGQYGQYHLDAVLDEASTQEAVFNELVLPQVNNFLQGVDSTVLVYGAGQTGKTYTLEGFPNGTREEGMIPRAVLAITKNLAPVPRHRYKLYVTYCALSAGVDAQLVDLLAPSAAPTSLKDGSATAAMSKLLHYQLESYEDIFEVLRQGRMTRMSALTGNANSPGQQGRPTRTLTTAAHVMLSIQLTGYAATGEQLRTNLSFVELAPPEAKDVMGNAVGTDSALTRSLSLAYASLTSVVRGLAAGGGRAESPSRLAHLHWRDSPLTRWLKCVMAAAASIAVLATVAPGPESAADTLSTLSYVSRLRSAPKDEALTVTATWDVAGAQPPLLIAGTSTVAPSRGGGTRGAPRSSSTPDTRPPTSVQRFGSPIQVGAGSPPTGHPASARDTRYSPPSQAPPSLDTRHFSPTTGTPYGNATTAKSGPGAGVGTPLSAAAPRNLMHDPQGWSAAGGSLHPGQSAHTPPTSAMGSLGLEHRAPHGGAASATQQAQLEHMAAELAAERRAAQELRAELARKEGSFGSSTSDSALTASHLGQQVDRLRQQLEAERHEKQLLVRRLQTLQEQLGPAAGSGYSMQDLQAESSLLEAQVRSLQDALDSTRASQAQMGIQLNEAQKASEALRAERDKLQRQNTDLSERLQGQVRSLSEETAKLRAQALDAANRVETEQVARKTAESSFAQLRNQMEAARGTEGSALAQVSALQAQARELASALEAARSERSKLQDLKWRADERIEQLCQELDAALAQQQRLAMEAKAASTKAESDLRSAVSAAEALKAELAATRAQADNLKHQLKAGQSSFEDQMRRESGAIRDVQEMEALMRELDRDLEVQAAALWRQLRAERADQLLTGPDSSAVAPARRWRPVLQALVAIIKRSCNDAEQQTQALDQARTRMSSLEAQAARSSELATSLAGLKQVQAEHLAEVEEARRSLTLMDEALGEANRECSRLHRQLEELSGAHKALTGEAVASEQLASSLAAERDALQRQVSSLGAVAQEDKLEKDALKLKAQARDQLLHVVWVEVRAAKLAALATPGAASPTAAASAFAATPLSAALMPRALTSHLDLAASPLIGGLDATPGGAAALGHLDWSDVVCQEQLLKALALVKAQIGKLQSDVSTLRGTAAMNDELAAQLTGCQAKLSDAQRAQEALQDKVSALEMQRREDFETQSSLQQQLAASQGSVSVLQSSVEDARKAVEGLQEEMTLLAKSRDTWKDTASQQEVQLKQLYVDGEARAGEVSRLRQESQAAVLEGSAATAKLSLLESQLRDAHTQLEAVTARLTATERALQEANARAADLNGRLVLADSEARLHAQELMARAVAAEDAEKLAKVGSSEQVERLEWRLKELSDGNARQGTELEGLRGERTELQLKSDDLSRQLLEAKARVMDAEHVTKQLQVVVSERDALQGQVHHLKNAHATAFDEVRTLKRQVDTAQEQLQRATDEKTRLAAQLEGQRLDHIMSNMAVRTSGRIGAMARGAPGIGGGAPPRPAYDVDTPGSAGVSGQRITPNAFARSYTGLAYPGSMPPGGMALDVQVSSPRAATKAYGEGRAYTALGGLHVDDAVEGVRVHVRAAPPHGYGL